MPARAATNTRVAGPFSKAVTDAVNRLHSIEAADAARTRIAVDELARRSSDLRASVGAFTH